MSEFKVSKSNELITSSFNFGLNEYRLVLYGISLVNPDDNQFPTSYQIDIQRFARLFNADPNHLYSDLKNSILNKFFARQITIKLNGDTKRRFHLLSSVDYNDKTGYLALNFSQDAKPFLNQLPGRFTSYYIDQISNFRSSYSIRFYEWAIMHLRIKEGKPENFEMSLKTIRERLELGNSYPLYANLKQRVIQKAVDEINKHSDIILRYEEFKKGRSVYKLKFTVKYKKWAKREKQYTLNFDPNLKVGQK